MEIRQHEQEVASQFVDVWEGRLTLAAEQIRSLFGFLGQDERERAQTFKLPQMRDRYIAVRGMLRQTLAGYLDVAPESLRFEVNEYGKPSLLCGSLHFNLSHSADVLMIAVANFAEIGIDVETIKMRPSLDSLAKRCFSANELTGWRQLPQDQKLQCFYRLWTKKEAFVKAVGRGIALGLELCEFELEVGGQLLAIPPDYGPVLAWQVTELAVSPEIGGALVTKLCPFGLSRRNIVIS